MLDATHDPRLRSWVASANGHADFPIQNLPFGIFTPPGGGAPRGGVAIGNEILDLPAAAPLLHGAARQAALAADSEALNGLLALGCAARHALRADVSALLAEGRAPQARPPLHAAAACTLHLPVRVGDYTDFYAGLHHATNTGRMLRPDAPLSPNYKYLPIAFHGRASSVCVSGTPVRRPNGQRKRGSDTAPSFGPSRNLDYELELGVWVGPGNALGEPIPIGAAAEHIAGYCLLNDWSARDIQGWEYQPLGPFLGKSFLTTVSPWLITPEALAPFRLPAPPRADGDPKPLDYLCDAADQRNGGLDIAVEVQLQTPAMRAQGLPPQRLALSHAAHLYWTPAQLLAHHASNGCNLRPGDLLGTGTISGPSEEGCGSLLELTQGGRKPVMLPDGASRRFLEDGDTVIMLARAQRAGAVGIGFGRCEGTVCAAP